jgi:hypothetical protein
MTDVRRNTPRDVRHHAETDLHPSTIFSTDDDREIRVNVAGDSPRRLYLAAHSILSPGNPQTYNSVLLDRQPTWRPHAQYPGPKKEFPSQGVQGESKQIIIRPNLGTCVRGTSRHLS